MIYLSSAPKPLGHAEEDLAQYMANRIDADLGLSAEELEFFALTTGEILPLLAPADLLEFRRRFTVRHHLLRAAQEAGKLNKDGLRLLPVYDRLLAQFQLDSCRRGLELM